MAPKPVSVECYSGHSYAQEPRAFTLRGERHVVAAVERTWRTPSGPHFRVRTQDDARFELAYDEQADRWRVNMIRHSRLDKEVNPNA